MREVAADGKRCRREDPCAARFVDLPAEHVGDRQRRRVQLPALRADVHPADPVIGRVAAQPGLPSLEAVGGGLGTPRDERDVFAAVGDEPHLACEAVETRGERFECFAERLPSGERLLRELARRVAGCEPELADQRNELGTRIGEVGDVAQLRSRDGLGIARKLRQLAGGRLLAEEQRRRVGQLMRFVENDRIARGQQLGEPLVAQRDVGEEQVVVDDDDVGVERFLARLHHEAFAMERAVAAEAVVARRRDERPDRRVFRNVGELRAVAALGRARERDDLRQIPRVGARRQPALARRALEMVMADVVGATLEQRDGDRRRQRVADQRQVALEQLVLQRLRSRRHDDLAAVEQRGNEIRECLARAGPGFGDQRPPQRDRTRDRLRHRELLRPEPKAGQLVRERAAVAEDRGELGLRRVAGDVVRQRRVQFDFAFADGVVFRVFGLAGATFAGGSTTRTVRIVAIRSVKSA